MNDNELRVDSNSQNTYHATSNLNTAIENPQINMNSAVGINIQNVGDNGGNNFEQNQISDNNDNTNQFYEPQNSYVANNFNSGFENNISETVTPVTVNSQFIPNISNDNVSDINSENISSGSDNFNNTYNDVEYKTVENVKYEPTMQEKKNPDSGFKVPREFKVMLFIVFILILFILLMPYIYDFFKELELVITT